MSRVTASILKCNITSSERVPGCVADKQNSFDCNDKSIQKLISFNLGTRAERKLVTFVEGYFTLFICIEI